MSREGEKTVEVSSPLSAVNGTTADRTPAHLQRSTVHAGYGERVGHAVGREDICIGWLQEEEAVNGTVEDEAGHKRWLLRGSCYSSTFTT